MAIRKFLVAAFFMAALTAASFYSAALDLDVSAKSAILLDAFSGEALYEKNADARLPMASTTKIMTAIVVLENTSPDDVVTVKKESTLVEGSSMYLREGERLKVLDLLYGLLMLSGNDAALALADFTGGDVESFVRQMNIKAGELGMHGTSYENPNGLDGEKHYTTARDMAALTHCAMENSVFREIVGTKSCTRAGRFMTNHNKLLWRYDGAEGVKTGYTRRSGRCLVTGASRGGRRLIAVTLGAPDDWNDHTRMLDFGFSHFSSEVLAEKGAVIAHVPVISGGLRTVPVRINAAVTASLSNGELEALEKRIELPRFVYAPIIQGELAGRIVFSLDGKTVAETTLSFCSDSGEYLPPPKPSVWRRIFSFFTALRAAAYCSALS